MSKSARLDIMRRAPLPTRNGVGPSRVYLPSGPWPRVLDFLVERFPYVPPDILRARLLAGDIVDETGEPQKLDSIYRPLRWLWYYREVAAEVAVPFDLPVLFRDDYLVAVDKPHFLASIPGGRYLRETALTRLRHSLEMPWLTPLHRLDRDTAGVLLFCAHPESRGAYQALFQSRQVYKQYEARAPLVRSLDFPLIRCSRLEARPGHFTMQEVPGIVNSETRIQLMSSDGCTGHFCLEPHTGRKHQLRVHMSALGMPILNDAFYPRLLVQPEADDFSRPLQLLARCIQFEDPITGGLRRFESRRKLGTGLSNG